MDQTIQLAFRIAIVWAAGFLLAVAVRALLPDQSGFTLAGQEGNLVYFLQPDRFLDVPAGRTHRDCPGGRPRASRRHWVGQLPLRSIK